MTEKSDGFEIAYQLESLLKSGECNLDAGIKAYGFIKEHGQEYIADKFNSVWTRYYNDELENTEVNNNLWFKRAINILCTKYNY